MTSFQKTSLFLKKRNDIILFLCGYNDGLYSKKKNSNVMQILLYDLKINCIAEFGVDEIIYECKFDSI